MTMRRSTIGWVSFGMLAVGAANWSVKGLFGHDLVAESLGGSRAFLARLVYTAVGIAGVYEAVRVMSSAMSPDPLEAFLEEAQPELATAMRD